MRRIGGTNDFVNNYQYQSVLGQMSQVTQTGNGGDAVAAKTVTFAYDRLGEFTSISRYQNADATANLVAQSTYGYDLNGNLTSLVYSNNGSTLPSYSWTYDPLGNMTSSNETLGSIVDLVNYTSDSTGQLLTATAATARQRVVHVRLQRQPRNGHHRQQRPGDVHHRAGQ